MPYCPECKYEYVTGVAVCQDCGTTLVDRLDEEKDYSKTEYNWKKLTTQPGVVYTEMLKEVLDERGIPCVLQPGNTSWLAAKGTSTVGSNPHLLVPEERYEECLKIIAELFGD
ncbi:DUF2007 domain-containing protein [candidate division KSB1 bacterium]